jgi:lipoprotein-anchoring transpeptidase ErfK/SrfK
MSRGKSAKRRTRTRIFFAVLLLLAILTGMFFIWRQAKHFKKIAQRPATVISAQPNYPAKPQNNLLSSEIFSATNLTSNEIAFPRSARTGLEIQIALARRAISPGTIDGVAGSQTHAAIAAFQRENNFFDDGILDPNERAQLTLDFPLLTNYVVTTNDLAQLQPLGKTWLEKSQQSALAYETELELVAEKAHASQIFIKKLNPDIDWLNISAGTVLQIPDVNYSEPPDKAAFVIIHLSETFLEAFDAQTNLLAHFPCSIAARFDKRPVGELLVKVLAPNPNYTFDPELFPESGETKKMVLPPGPNNPVGVAWIGLDKPGYGIHGTPAPEQIGRTESHGCFRLANWDADYLLKLSWIGMPVFVEP